MQISKYNTTKINLLFSAAPDRKEGKIKRRNKGFKAMTQSSRALCACSSCVKPT